VQEARGEPPRVEVAQRPDGLAVTLREPAEPLAWAIDVAREGGAFVTAWSSERAPGARTRPAQTEALLREVHGPVDVRVYYDDGRVGVCTAKESE
jgi:hypothetical protein